MSDNDLISKIIIGVLSATFAISLKQIIDYIQRKIDLNNKRKVLVDLIDNVILVNLRKHLDSYNSLLIHYNSKKIYASNISHFITTSLDSKLLTFFSQRDLVDIFKKVNIKMSDFYEGIYDLDTFKSINPVELEKAYLNTIENVMVTHINKNNMSIIEIMNTQSYFYDFNEDVSFHFKKFEHSINQQIYNVKNYISKFERIVTELK